jgi:hypothetical protein
MHVPGSIQLDGWRTFVLGCCCASMSVSAASLVSSGTLLGRCAVIPSCVVASPPPISVSSAILAILESARAYSRRVR